jgi:hypothetical protein
MKKKILVAIISILSIIILSIFIGFNYIPASDNLQFYEWHKIWDDGDHNRGYSICDDENGSVYITGSSYNYDTKVLSPHIIQYDQSGRKIWELTWEEHDYCRAITIDNESNLYIGGDRYNPIFENSSFMLMKLNKSKQLEWGRIWGISEWARINEIALDSLGNIYAVGQTQDLNILRKYNTNGSFLWETSWVRYTSYISGKIDIDSTDNIYITGNSGDEMFLVKYNSTGDLDWYKTFGADNQSIRATDIVVDSCDIIYTCGYVDISLPSPGAYVNDVFVAKFNASGVQMWNKTWGGSSYDQASGIAVDLNDNLYITGSTNSYKYQKLFVLKFSTEGMKMWSNVLDFSVEDAGKDIIVDPFGDIYVVGNTFTINGGSDILIVKMSSIPPPPQIPGYYIFPLLIVSIITLIIIGIRNIKLYKKKLDYAIRIVSFMGRLNLSILIR